MKKKKEYEEAEYLYKTNCTACGSSDANAIYSNGGTHCFSCGHHTFPDSNKLEERQEEKVVAALGSNMNLVSIDLKELPKRKLSLETVTKFNYGVHDGKQVATYYDVNGNPVAQKFRTKDKDFSWIGETKKPTLFGQQLWAPNAKRRIVITEGEIDAMSISQAQGNKWAVVSVPNGANGAKRDIANNLEYLNGFKEVVLCFDNDEAGKKAVAEVAPLFQPNKCFICILPTGFKDANEMLVAGKNDMLIQSLWDSKKFKPDGILNGEDILTKLSNEEVDTSYPFPDWLQKTNSKTKGIRLGELDVYTSGTGSGKTTLIKQLQMHYFKTTDLNQGLIHLEEPLKNTANGLVGIDLQRRLHLEDAKTLTDDPTILSKRKELFLAKDNQDYYRFNLYDAFGSVEEDKLYDLIRFMVKGLGCQVIWLDHLSILVSSLGQDSDERRAIDNIMHQLKSLTIELKCYIGLIVHLNNSTNGKTFEEGAIPNLNNLRGSGGIKQLSDSVYAFSRNQQAESELERNTSLITVLKCRYTGSTGSSDYVYFNSDTGCLQAGVNPKDVKDIGKEHDANEFE